MTQEETKRAIKVMQAYVDGKQIQVRNGMGWRNCLEPTWAWYGTTFRIAPDQEEPKEKHYRPYTMEEFIEEMRKHDGFVKSYDTSSYGVSPYKISQNGIEIYNLGFVLYKTLLERTYTWSDDGTPCGKEVEK